MNEITHEERTEGHKRALLAWMNFYTPSSGAGMTVLKEQLVKALAELHTRADEERLERIAMYDRLQFVEARAKRLAEEHEQLKEVVGELDKYLLEARIQPLESDVAELKQQIKGIRGNVVYK